MRSLSNIQYEFEVMFLETRSNHVMEFFSKIRNEILTVSLKRAQSALFKRNFVYIKSRGSVICPVNAEAAAVYGEAR